MLPKNKISETNICTYLLNNADSVSTIKINMDHQNNKTLQKTQGVIEINTVVSMLLLPTLQGPKGQYISEANFPLKFTDL